MRTLLALLPNNIKEIQHNDIGHLNWIYELFATNNIQNQEVIHYWIRDAESRNFIAYLNDNGLFELLDGYCIVNQNSNDIHLIRCCRGAIHSIDSPAIEFTDGNEWYNMGHRHRNDGPAIDRCGFKTWYLDNIIMTLEDFWDAQKDTEFASQIVANQYGKKER